MLPPLKMPMWENLSRFARAIERLHAAHGEPGHGPVRLICEGAEVGVNEGNQIFNEHSANALKLNVRPPGPAMLRDRGLSATPWDAAPTPSEPPGT